MAKERTRSRGSNELGHESSLNKTTELLPSTADDEGRKSNAPLEEDPDLWTTKKKRKSISDEVLDNCEGKQKKMKSGSDHVENSEGKSKRKKVGNNDVRLINAGGEANEEIGIGEVQQDYSIVEQTGEGKKKKKKVGFDDFGLKTPKSGSNVSIDIEQDPYNCVVRGSESNANTIRKNDMKGDRVTHDPESKVEMESMGSEFHKPPTRSTVDVQQTGERKKKKKEKKVGFDDFGSETPKGGSNVSVDIEQYYSHGVVRGSESNANPVKKNKMKRDRATHDSESKVEMESMGSEFHKPPTRSSSKGEFKAKNQVKFQVPVNEFDEVKANYMFLERDIEVEIRKWKKDMVLPGLLYGRFSKAENETIKNSVLKYIETRGWDMKEGLEKVLHSSQHADARGCWIEIAKCLPVRPVKQLYRRATIVLGGEKLGNWSADELEQLTNLYKLHGDDWGKIASNMDRSARLCRERWRHLKHASKTGSWTQEELDKLCKLVRRSLRVKASIPAKTLDRRHIRDDINWEWIAEQMQRDPSRCADAWYKRLASPMIPTKWANGDDHLLLQKLMDLGASSEEALDWDTILDHRDGDQCMGRWKEMTKLLGTSDHVAFEDKWELLAKRYAPDLLGMEEEI